MLRVILDTNVLIEGAKDPNSYPARIIALVQKGELVPLTSERVMREYQRKVQELVVDQAYLREIEALLAKAISVAIHSRLGGITQDRDDDKFVELAQDGDADYLISDDQHLLDLQKHGETEIMSPEQFWNTYQEVAKEAVGTVGY